MFRSQILFCVSCCVGFSCLPIARACYADGIQSAQDSSEATTKPIETWPDSVVSEREFDFGRVGVGETPSHRFQLTNTTKRKLNVHSVTTSCGCMKAVLAAKTIPIGGSVDLVVTAQTEKFRGEKRASVHVRFDRPINEIKFVTAVEISNFLVEPAGLQVFATTEMKDQQNVVQISNPADKDWEIVKISTSCPSLTAVIKETKGSDGATQLLECRFNNQGPAELARQQQIVVYTSDLYEPKIVIPVEIQPESSPIQCTKEPLIFSASDWNEKRTRKLLIVTREESEIEKISIGGDLWRVHEPNPGSKKTHVLHVIPAKSDQAGGEYSGVLEGKIVVETSSGLSCEAAVTADLKKEAVNKEAVKPASQYGADNQGDTSPSIPTNDSDSGNGT